MRNTTLLHSPQQTTLNLIQGPGLREIRKFPSLPPTWILKQVQRLSFWSSGFPWCLGPDDGVGEGEQASSDSDERDLLGFSCEQHAIVERFEDRVGSAGDQGSHVEDCSN